jgi:hypothetical protein
MSLGRLFGCCAAAVTLAAFGAIGAACNDPSSGPEPPPRYLSEALQRVAEKTQTDAGVTTIVDREELHLREENAHLVPPMSSAANPLGWADEAERRCAEGLSTERC